MDSRTHKLAVVVASEMTIKAFLLGHLAAWCSIARVTVFANTHDNGILSRAGLSATLSSVAIERPIRPVADIRALGCLYGRLRRGAYDAVLSVTPKAGLLGMTAAMLARVPVRIHIFTGQVWATRHGPMRILLKSLDRLIARFATHVLVDGEPQRQFLIREGVLAPAKSRVLVDGSLCGVDAERFRPDADARRALRAELHLGDEVLLFLYLGRFNRDKGVVELAQAFARLAADRSDVCMVMVGPDEGGLKPVLEQILGAHASRVRFADFTDQPERYMAAADIFCLPSHREGFPTSILEAAACGLPTIASRIYGIEGALVDGQGGLMHDSGDVDGILACMRRLVAEPALRHDLAGAARNRAIASFATSRVVGAFSAYLEERLHECR